MSVRDDIRPHELLREAGPTHVGHHNNAATLVNELQERVAVIDSGSATPLRDDIRPQELLRESGPTHVDHHNALAAAVNALAGRVDVLDDGSSMALRDDLGARDLLREAGPSHVGSHNDVGAVLNDLEERVAPLEEEESPYDALVLATDDLLDYWPLDSRLGENLGSGADWSESSGDPGWEAEDGYLYLPPGAAVTAGDTLHLDGRYDEFTLEGWIKPKSAPESYVVTFLMKDYYEAPFSEEFEFEKLYGEYLLWGYDSDPEVDNWISAAVGSWTTPPSSHIVSGGPTYGGFYSGYSHEENPYPVGEWSYFALVFKAAGGIPSSFGYGSPLVGTMLTLYGPDGVNTGSYNEGIAGTYTLNAGAGTNPVYLGTHPLEDPSFAPDMAIARMAFYDRALTPEEIAARVALGP